MSQTTIAPARVPRPIWPMIALALAILAIVARVLPGPRTIDDAFITFRYSRNLIDGLGFVYNPGVHTLGTTTPLFTLWMALMGVIGGREAFPWAALLTSAAADAVNAVLLYTLARRVTRESLFAALPGLLWAISPRSVTFAVGGMETSVTILWMLAAFTTFVTHRTERLQPRPLIRDSRLWVGIFAGLGLLTRIDSALWVGPLLLAQLFDNWHERSRQATLLDWLPWRTWAGLALIQLPWMLFSLVYFGSPFPNSVSAKTVAYIMPPLSAMATLLQNYATPFFEFDGFGSVGAQVGALLYLVFSLFGLLYSARHTPRLVPFIIYPMIYFLVFAAANPLIFRWYMAPPMPAYSFGIFAGLWAVARVVGKQRSSLSPVGAALMLVFAAAWVYSSLSGWTLHPDHGADRPAPKMAFHELELFYQDVGIQLRDEYNTTFDTRVASADIGVIGYFSGATIIDTVGLVTPELRRYYPVNRALILDDQNYAIPPALILDTQPDFLVTMEGFIRQGLLRESAFTEAYALVREIPTGYYGTGVQLYRREEE